MNKNIFNDFLEHYQKIKSNQINLSKNDRSGFNFLDLMQTDEVGLSKLLAFLLDPNQSHNQGNLFLSSFLEKLGLDKFKNNFDTAYIFVENHTSENRRHDIFIQGVKNNATSWVISIENKLRGACDQPEQLTDYYKDLERYHQENLFVLYLPSYKRVPSENSIMNWDKKVSNQKGKVWTPQELSDWLSNLEITSDRIKMLVEDFIVFLETEILGMNQLNSELLYFSLENKENRELVLDIFSIQDTFYKALKDKLIYQLREKFDNDKLFDKNDWELVTENKEPYYEYELIQLIPKHYPFTIHFEKDNGGMYYGFKWKDLNDVESKNKYLPIIQKIAGGTTSNWWGKWIWCPKVPLNLRYWDKQVWLEIDSGKTATQIWTEINKLWSQFIHIAP